MLAYDIQAILFDTTECKNVCIVLQKVTEDFIGSVCIRSMLLGFFFHM